MQSYLPIRLEEKQTIDWAQAPANPNARFPHTHVLRVDGLPTPAVWLTIEQPLNFGSLFVNQPKGRTQI